MKEFNENNPRSATDFVGIIARSANWAGDSIALFRAAPLDKTLFKPWDFIAALENLGVNPVSRQTDLRSISKHDLPCLCLSGDETPKLLTEIRDDLLVGIEAYSGQPVELKRGKTHASILRAEPDPNYEARMFPSSFWETVNDLGRVIAPLFFMSLLINLLALAGPLLVMTVYDTVIPSNSTQIVWHFAGIVVFILGADFVIRYMRAGVLARIGTAAERRLSLALFTKLNALPLAQVSRSTTHSQMGRIRQFESIRDIFSGSLLVNILDFPFAILFLVVVFSITPEIGLLLCAIIIVFVVMTLFLYPKQKALAAKAAIASNDHTALLHEIAEHETTLRHFGLSRIYAERSETLGELAFEANRRSKSFMALSQNIGQTLVSAATLSSIVFAAYLAMDNSISFGALVAVATLSAKVLGPVNIMSGNILRLKGLMSSSQQITTVLKMDTELMRNNAQSRLKRLQGSITAKGLFVKFEAASEPSLAGVNLEIEPNSLVVLSGHSGAGKSTLLKCISKLNQPASGSLSIDGINVKQMTVEDLRNAVSLTTQDDFTFNMTLRENLLLGNPWVDDDGLLELYDALGAGNDLRRFYMGLDTDLSKVAKANFSANVLGTISIIRCLAKPSPIFLIDDPFPGMSAARVNSIWNRLKEISKTSTVIIVTHHLQHLMEADQVIYLEKGRVVIDEPGEVAGRKVHQMMQLDAHREGVRKS